MEQANNRLLPTVNVCALEHPFTLDRIEFSVPEGASIAELIEELRTRGALGLSNARVLLGDWPEPIPQDKWAAIRPKAGIKIHVIPVPQGGGGGKDPLRSILTVAVIAAGGWAGGAAAASFGSVGGAFVNAAVVYSGMYLINQIAPPPEPEGAPEVTEQLAVTGTRNEARRYQPVPKIYGKHRIYTDYAAEPYTEIVGQAVYLRSLFCVGHGPLQITDIKIGETAIDTYENVEYEVKDLAAGDSVPTLFTNSVDSTSLSITLSEDGSWHEQTTTADTDEVTADITFPGGLIRVENDGTKRELRVKFEIQHKLSTDSTWIDSELTTIGPGTSTSTSPFTGNDGELFVRRKEYGLFRVGFQIEFGASGQYDVRIKRVLTEALIGDTWEEKDPEGSKQTAEATLSTFRSVHNESPLDTTEFDDGVYIAVRIQASDQLNGIIDRLNCVAESKLVTYDGSSLTAPVVTRNPAWAYLDVLLGNGTSNPVNSSRVDLDAIKTWADNNDTESRTFDLIIRDQKTVFERLKTIAASARASFGYGVDGKFSVVEDRAQTQVKQHFTPRNSWAFEAQKVFVDQPHALKIQFVNASADYAQDERIVYDDGYSVDGSGGTDVATKFQTLKLVGITDEDLAWKDGRYHIATSRLRPETYRIRVDAENLICTRGDLVRVSHDVPLWGLYWGRIKSVTTDGSGNVTEFVVDEEITMALGTTYGIRIRLDDGTSYVTDVVTVDGTTTTIEPDPAIPSASAPAGGELFQFGESGSESVELLINKIDMLDDLTASLTLIDYNSAVYTADSGTIPAFSSNITLPPEETPNPPPTPEILSLTSDETVLAVNSDGSLTSQIRLAFAVPEDPTKPKVAGIQVQFRLADPVGEWLTIPAIAGDQRVAFVSPVDDNETYDVRVRTVTEFGIESDWATESAHTVSGKTNPPPDVAGFSVQQNGALTVMQWDEVQVKDLRGYEIRFGVQGASSWEDSNTVTKAAKGTVITDASIPPGSWDLFIKSIDTSGNYATNADSASITITSTFNVISSLQQDPTWPGMIDGFILHHTGVLVPDSQTLAADMTDEELWNTFVSDPVPTSTYMATELAATFDDDVRIWGDVVAKLGPGETGTIEYGFEIATRGDGEVYTGADTTEDWGLITDAVTASEDWGSITDTITDDDIEDWGFVPDTTPWAIGSTSAKYVYQMVQFDNVAGNIAYLDAFTTYIDLSERTEEHQDVVISSGGTTVTFDDEFHSKPIIKALADGASALYVVKSNTTTTGTTFSVYDSSGTDVGGTIDYEATGV